MECSCGNIGCAVRVKRGLVPFCEMQRAAPGESAGKWIDGLVARSNERTFQVGRGNTAGIVR